MDEKKSNDFYSMRDDYPMVTAEYRGWCVRELHFHECIEIAKKTLEKSHFNIQPGNEPWKAEDLIALFSIIVRITQKSICFPDLKKHFGNVSSILWNETIIPANKITR